MATPLHDYNSYVHEIMHRGCPKLRGHNRRLRAQSLRSFLLAISPSPLDLAGCEFTIRGIAARAKISTTTVQKDVKVLVRAGVLVCTAKGYRFDPLRRPSAVVRRRKLGLPLSAPSKYRMAPELLCLLGATSKRKSLLARHQRIRRSQVCHSTLKDDNVLTPEGSKRRLCYSLWGRENNITPFARTCAREVQAQNPKQAENWQPSEEPEPIHTLPSSGSLAVPRRGEPAPPAACGQDASGQHRQKRSYVRRTGQYQVWTRDQYGHRYRTWVPLPEFLPMPVGAPSGAASRPQASSSMPGPDWRIDLFPSTDGNKWLWEPRGHRRKCYPVSLLDSRDDKNVLFGAESNHHAISRLDPIAY